MADGCWNTIGVRGNGSCPELAQYIHCRNCPVYTDAAVALLDNVPPVGYVAHWTSHVAEPRRIEERHTHAAVVFRIGTEWLALATTAVSEVLASPTIHSLPHRRDNVVLGVANVRGELLVCASLGRVLGLDEPADPAASPVRSRRMLIMGRQSIRVACPVDEVQGVERFHERDLRELPVTLARAGTRCSRKLLSSGERSIGLLDEEMLFSTLKRSLA